MTYSINWPITARSAVPFRSVLEIIITLVHGTRLGYCVAVLHIPLLQTCGHLTHRTSTRLTMPSGQSCSSVCIRPESMISTSCDSILSPCGVDWNSALWMTPLISGNVVCKPVLTLKADILNITQAYKLLVRILCWYFNAFVQTFQCSCEKTLFSDFARSSCVLHTHDEVRHFTI